MAKLFVSYSRRDSVAARKLIEALKAMDQQVWVDWESIPPAVDWLEQIFRGIEESDAFIFMISPDSIASEVCKVEINRAAQNNKRIIPIVLRDVPAKDAPENIRKLNWTFIREGDNFEEGLAKVKTAIELDLDWLEEHRRLQVRALEWHRKKDPSLFLRGRDLRNARHMLATATSKDPIPTELQTTFIQHSARNERNRTIAWLATGITLIIMAVLSYTTYQQSVRAAQNEKVAIANAALAEEKRQEAEAARLEEEKQRQLAEEAREQEAQQRQLAVQNEIAAEAQRSAARAQIYLNRPGELYTSTLLAIDSMRRLPSDEAEEILRRNINLFPVPVAQFAQAGKINALALNPQGDVFVTASADGTTCAWKIEEEKIGNLFCTPASRTGVNALAFNPDGSFLVTGDQAGLVQVLDPENGDVLHAFQRVGTASGQTEIVDVENAADQTPTGLPVRNINVRPTREQKLVVIYDDGRIPIFDPITGKLSARISSIDRPNVSGLSPNGAWLLTGSEAGRVSILNLASDKRFSPTTHRGGVLAMAFSPPPVNKVVTAGNDTIAVINMSTERELFRIPIQSPVRDIAFSPDGSWFVTGSDDHRIRVWDTLTGNERISMSQDGIVMEVAVSSDGKWIASTGDDRTVRMWNETTGAEIFQIPLKASGSRLAFVNEDKWLVTTDVIGNIAIWDISGVALPQVSLSFGAIVNHVQYSPSGEWLAVSSRDKVWLFRPGLAPSLNDLEVRQPVLDLNANIAKMAFSSDSGFLGILTEENEVVLYNFEERRRQDVQVATNIQSIAFSPDGQQLITSDMEGNLQAWDTSNGEMLSDTGDFPQGTSLASAGRVLAVGSPGKITLLGVDGDGVSPTFEFSGDNVLLVLSTDSSLLASSSSGGEVTVFQNDDGQLTKLSSFVKGQATSLAFDPAGKLLAVGTAKNVYLMDVTSGKEVARIPHLSTVNGVSFSTDGSYLVTASSQTLQFWVMSEIHQIQSADLIAAACSDLIENFSPSQWETFFGTETYERMCPDLPEPK